LRVGTVLATNISAALFFKKKLRWTRMPFSAMAYIFVRKCRSLLDLDKLSATP
jgi:hypothetical protein